MSVRHVQFGRKDRQQAGREDLQRVTRLRQILREAMPIDPNVIRTDEEKEKIEREGFEWLIARIQEYRRKAGLE